MRRFLKYFVLAIVGQIGLLVISGVLLSITRNDLFGWIFVVYFAVPSAVLRVVTGDPHYEGTFFTLLSISSPLIIVGLLIAGIALFIFRHIEKTRTH